MKKLSLVWALSLLGLASSAFAVDYYAKCVEAAQGMGNDFVCRSINNVPTWCNVSASGCHTDLANNGRYSQVAQANDVCTQYSPVSNNGVSTITGSVIWGLYFTPSVQSRINKANNNACFYYNADSLIHGWDPNDSTGSGRKVE